MKIEFSIINFPKQKVTENISSFIELMPDYFRIVYEFYADEPKNDDDEQLGWENQFNYLNVYVKKDSITSVEVSRTTNPTRFRVMLSAYGIAEDVKIFFRKKEEAEAFADKIRTWWLNEHTETTG